MLSYYFTSLPAIEDKEENSSILSQCQGSLHHGNYIASKMEFDVFGVTLTEIVPCTSQGRETVFCTLESLGMFHKHAHEGSYPRYLIRMLGRNKVCTLFECLGCDVFESPSFVHWMISCGLQMHLELQDAHFYPSPLNRLIFNKTPGNLYLG